TQVALVTGRVVDDLRRFLDIPQIYYVGVHGAEIRFPDGAVQLAEGIDSVRAALEGIKQQLQDALATRPGILIEDKGVALSVHYRRAARADAGIARRFVAAQARDLQRRGVPITLVHGHQVAEIRPVQVNKGRAVCTILATAGDDALPIYIGDDQ